MNFVEKVAEKLMEEFPEIILKVSATDKESMITTITELVPVSVIEMYERGFTVKDAVRKLYPQVYNLIINQIEIM